MIAPPAESKMGAPPAAGPMNLPDALTLPPATRLPAKLFTVAFFRGMFVDSLASFTVPVARFEALRAVIPDPAPAKVAAVTAPEKPAGPVILSAVAPLLAIARTAT